jgi:hypothetical protein
VKTTTKKYYSVKCIGCKTRGPRSEFWNDAQDYAKEAGWDSEALTWQDVLDHRVSWCCPDCIKACENGTHPQQTGATP